MSTHEEKMKERLTALRCPYCNKRVHDEGAGRQHHAAKHRGKKLPALFAKRDGGEQSIASLMIEAQISHAMGDPVEDWLANMMQE